MEVEYEFINISDDEVAEAITAEIKEAALVIIRKDLVDYINKMGMESSFKGWIAHICPENVTVDKRLELPRSDWCLLWNTEIYNFKNKQDAGDNMSKKRKQA